MQRWLVLIVALLAAPAQPAIDFTREDRWAQEVVPSLVVGDAVYLVTTAQPQVLAILTAPSGVSKGGVIVIHGPGVHPDFGFISGVRTGLAEVGYTTLSVQMPVLVATERCGTSRVCSSRRRRWGAVQSRAFAPRPSACPRAPGAAGVRGVEGVAPLRAQGHDDHARTDVAGAGYVDCLAGDSPVPARLDPSGFPEVN